MGVNGNGQDAPAEIPEVVQPRPTTFTWKVESTQTADGEPVVIVAVFTVTGSTVLFLEVETARAVAQALRDHASGLTLPPKPKLHKPR